MLILTRRTRESLRIGDSIKVTVVGVLDDQIQIRVEAPDGLAIRPYETEGFSTGGRNIAAGRCCWHCQHYVRPYNGPRVQLDGEPRSLCMVDRQPNHYAPKYQLQPGDKPMEPDGYCDRFEMDRPPALRRE